MKLLLTKCRGGKTEHQLQVFYKLTDLKTKILFTLELHIHASIILLRLSQEFANMLYLHNLVLHSW